MPDSYAAADEPLTSFAAKLWEEPARLEALVNALVANPPPNPNDEKVRRAIVKAAELVAKTIAPPDSELTLATTANRQKAEDDLKPLLQPLLDSLLAGGTIRTRALAAAMFGEDDATVTDAGKEALAAALGHRAPPPSDPGHLLATRVKAFFTYIITQANTSTDAERKEEFNRLRSAIKTFGAVIGPEA
jgi:hypothetical protein